MEKFHDVHKYPNIENNKEWDGCENRDNLYNARMQRPYNHNVLRRFSQRSRASLYEIHNTTHSAFFAFVISLVIYNVFSIFLPVQKVFPTYGPIITIAFFWFLMYVLFNLDNIELHFSQFLRPSEQFEEPIYPREN